MKITKTTHGRGERFGARKYAEVASETENGKAYQVVKIRIKGSRNYTYRCSCPDHLYRQRACKHIKSFQKGETK